VNPERKKKSPRKKKGVLQGGRAHIERGRSTEEGYAGGEHFAALKEGLTVASLRGRYREGRKGKGNSSLDSKNVSSKSHVRAGVVLRNDRWGEENFLAGARLSATGPILHLFEGGVLWGGGGGGGANESAPAARREL